jgi:iron complex outermembrane receptor protein
MFLTASSTFNYDDLPVDTIKRLEIVRGPGSTMYGSNAFLAVINIITQNAKDLNGFQVSAGGGSFDTQQYRASWGKQFDNSFEAALHFNFTDTNGIGSPLYADSSRSTLGKSQLTEGRYDFEWQLGFADFKFEGRYINKKQGPFFGLSNFLSDQRSKQNYEDYFLKLSRKWNVTADFTLDTQLFHDALQYRATWEVAPNTLLSSAFQDSRTGGEIQANYAFSDTQTLMTGFSYAKETHGNLKDELNINAVISPAPHTSAAKSRSRWGIYAQDVWDPFTNLHLTLGIRYDRYSDFGGTLNPRMGFNWEFIQDYSLKFSYGTAYRAPAFGELTLINNPTLQGNSALTPELAKTFEGGIVARPLAGLTTQAIYYHTAIEKIITPVKSLGAAIPQYQNNGHVTAQGIEIEARYDFSAALQGSYLSANSVWQDSMQQGRRLADVPRYRTNLMANWAIDKTWSSFAHLLIKSSTVRNPGDVRANAPGYTIMNLGLVGKNLLGQKIDLGFNIYNLFDKRYYDPAPQNLSFVGDFQAAGIAFFGHVSVGF